MCGAVRACVVLYVHVDSLPISVNTGYHFSLSAAQKAKTSLCEGGGRGLGGGGGGVS